MSRRVHPFIKIKQKLAKADSVARASRAAWESSTHQPVTADSRTLANGFGSMRCCLAWACRPTVRTNYSRTRADAGFNIAIHLIIWAGAISIMDNSAGALMM